MDDEEAEQLLRALGAGLGEFGGEASTEPRRALPEDGVVNIRGELERVLEEYEALLVAAPHMMRRTMQLLGTRRLTFSIDVADSAGTHSDDREPSILSVDDVGEWLRIAAEAEVVIAQLRKRLNDQSR